VKRKIKVDMAELAIALDEHSFEMHYYLDLETGEVMRVLRRTPTGTEQVHTHPATGASFDGLKFPEWGQMREVVMRGAAALPKCHFQGWDVALTDRGPVLVELEGDGGDPIMQQLCFDSGILQGRYLEFCQRALQRKKESAREVKSRLRKRFRKNLAQLAFPQEQGAGGNHQTAAANGP